MGKNLIGIDMGRDRLKIALVNGTTVKKSAVAQMPENMMKQGLIVSVDVMGQLIRDTMREAGIHGSKASVALSDDAVFVRNAVMPIMTAEQLAVNLPYECRDYITGELNNYVFDYAMLTEASELKRRFEAAPAGQQADNESDNETGRNMELLAVAIQKSVLDDVRTAVRKAGLKLEGAAPAVCVYANLIRSIKEPDKEYCLLDLGCDSIRMHMYRSDCHNATRELEIGLALLDEIIADAYNVDTHLAHTYLLTNYENCQRHEACMSFYNRAAVELMRAVNFYQFSNPDSNMEAVYALGGGTAIKPFIETIKEMLPVPVRFASELVKESENIQDCDSVIQAICAALN